MTEYGRGPGPEPWYPDNDPLYGERDWAAEQGQGVPQPGQQDGWDQYGQQQYQQGQGYDPQYGQQDQHGQQQYYGQQGGWDQGGNGGQYGAEQYGGQYQDGQYDQTGQFYANDPYAGQQAAGYGADAYQDPYAAQGYQQGQQGQQPQQHGQQPYSQDPYQQAAFQQQQEEAAAGPGAPAAEPRPPAPRRHDTAPDSPPDTSPDPDTGWDPGPDQGESDFFSKRDDDDWSDTDDRADRRGSRTDKGDKGDKQKRRRGGCGCMVAAVLVVGALGGVAYWGYGFYQDRFGPPADFSGEGTGEVEFTVEDGDTLSDIGNRLRNEGVVASHDAFVAAAGDQGIEVGIYTLRREMSAEAAVALLLEGPGANALIIPEGERAADIYTIIDERLGLDEGTTAEVAETADLGLPDWAEGDIEGFLWPARYDVGEGTTPEDLLTQMVQRAEAEFTEIDLEDAAAGLDRSPREILTIASLIQAEAQADEEFGKVSRVIYNRLDIDMMLQFDSTVNYALNRSTLDVSLEDTEVDSPYNTYEEYGLPPGPIENPGHQALEAALNPEDGPWLYFVTVTPGDTRFTDDYEEHDRNRDDFNEAQQQGDG
ncbi:endolytic transglycosylase MltG [Streptomyces sp. NPDC049879]|uniref:endolytic transglycosylase MltG n=1 Tax=Streptomyces sp. NPDC049879 TaxID=3365598 RepID=UPI003793568B